MEEIERKEPASVEAKRREHKERHILLHKYLDELLADFFIHTNKLFSETPTTELMSWSHKQTTSPTEVK